MRSSIYFCVYFLVDFPLVLQLIYISLYAGEARSVQPKFDVCLIQASLIYGSTVKCVELRSFDLLGQLTTNL